MKTIHENEALLRSVRVVLAEAAQLEAEGEMKNAALFGRVAANTLARYIATEDQRERFSASPAARVIRTPPRAPTLNAPTLFRVK